MRNRKWQPIAVCAGAALFAAFLLSEPGQTQNGGTTGTAVAVSSVVNSHTHVFGLEVEDLVTLAGELRSDDQEFTLQSSSAFNDGVLNKEEHSHEITLTRAQLTQIAAGETVKIESGQTEGHTHIFQFIPMQQCPGAAVGVAPAPTGSPSVGPSASPSVSPSASPSVSPSVSPSPSASPSVSPSPSPSISPSPRPSVSPAPVLTPLPTFSPIITVPQVPQGPIVR